MFVAYVNLMPPVTDERKDTLIVHSARAYKGSVRAKVTKDGEEVANVGVRSLGTTSVFAFRLGEHQPPFGVEITQDGKAVDTGTIDAIAEAH